MMGEKGEERRIHVIQFSIQSIFLIFMIFFWDFVALEAVVPNHLADALNALANTPPDQSKGTDIPPDQLDSRLCVIRYRLVQVCTKS